MTTPSTIAVRPELLRQLHQLAADTQRPESDLIDEALRTYLETDRRYVETLTRRMAEADEGRFASDEEAEAFFIKFGD